MTDEELKDLVASLAIDQKELSKKFAETDKRIEKRMKHTDEQMKRTDEKLERIGIHLGNVTQNQGDVAEEFFFNSLANDAHLGTIYFDNAIKNMSTRKGKLEEEYDIVLTNGDAIAVIEVKYKAHSNDLQKLGRQLGNFKKLFPGYQSCKVYGALASFHINDDAKREALDSGYFVLQRFGDVIHTENNEQLAVF